jgi:hypothetical protein
MRCMIVIAVSLFVAFLAMNVLVEVIGECGSAITIEPAARR